MPGDALDVFIAYSHEDETLRRELEEQLVRLRSEGLVGTWHQRRITDGEQWRGWIDRDLMSADVILLVVSAPFLASGYCQDAEIKHALDLHASRLAKVIPIIARPCDWASAPFAELTTSPQGVGPVTEWHDPDSAWEEVGQAIRDFATRLETVRLEDTAAYRLAVQSLPRETDRPTASAAKASEPRTPRLAILGGLAATLAAVWLLVVWVKRSEDGTAPVQVAEVTYPGTAPRAAAVGAIEQPAALAPAAVIRPETEPERPAPDQVQPPAEAAPVGRAPEESPPPEIERHPEEHSAVTAEPESAPAEPATAAEDDAPPEPAAEDRQADDFERSLSILATAGAEDEGDCLAVLVADEYALTSRACAQASTVAVMGGNALTATRDDIFDLEPRQSAQTTDINIVKLLQGLGETYGFASTELAESFDYERLNAHYVEASTIRPAECVAETRLSKIDGSGRAYVENAAFDRYVHFVEEAAGEAISIAGSRWAALLSEVLGSTGDGPAGFVCGFPQPPASNLVFSVGGRVVGIGYPCEPLDRLEPEVRDSLPPEIRRLDLDCIASLSEIREGDRDPAGSDFATWP